MGHTRRVVPFTELGRSDIGRVGGKNASLGELTGRLTAAGLRLPPGFATTADAYEELLDGRGSPRPRLRRERPGRNPPHRDPPRTGPGPG
ncbi:PEP/pyruvate-binding domain-containing protein [Streptomyces sp. NBC_00424]